MQHTIICDLDGVLVEQHENYIDRVANRMPFQVLPGTLEKLKEWESKNYRFLLITARKESSRRFTEKTLSELGIFYDQLIMGVGVGPRVLINDMKPGRDVDMAIAVNLRRNQGIAGIEI